MKNKVQTIQTGLCSHCRGTGQMPSTEALWRPIFSDEVLQYVFDFYARHPEESEIGEEAESKVVEGLKERGIIRSGLTMDCRSEMAIQEAVDSIMVAMLVSRTIIK